MWSTKRLGVLGLVLAIAWLYAGATCGAQALNGSLSGNIVDESGALVPGADVSITNDASQDVRRTVTNGEGFFTFASVPPGTYTVRAQLSGFKTAELTGVVIRVGDSRSLGQITLAVGGQTEQIVVALQSDMVPLNSGEKSATLTADQIENIPIVGRSATELLKILPGLSPRTVGTQNRPSYTGEVIGINGNGEAQGGGGNNQSAIGNYAGNGGRGESMDLTIDGAPAMDPGCNCGTSVNPNPEMTQEFKVLQSNFNAEHAKGPVTMSVLSKSGGREFHGTLYGYWRDYHMNSNDWFANKVGSDRIKNEFFYPGGNVGGPLIIPGTDFNKNRDKVFFFLGYEYFKQRIDTGFVRSWVPTVAMRNGDFSGVADLGLSGDDINRPPDGFANGIIPAGEIDPGGKALLNLYPMPNADPSVSGGFNYVDNLLVDQNGTQLATRVDLNFSDNTKMFVRYNRQREVQPFVIGLWWRNGENQVPYPSSISGKNRSDSATTGLTHVFSPTLTNETVFAITYIDFPNSFDDPTRIARASVGYPYQGVFGDSPHQMPSLFSDSWLGTGPSFFNPGGFDPVLYATPWQITAQNNTTKVLGAHTLKAGFYLEHVTNAQPGSGDSEGVISNSSSGVTSTGNTLADILLGRVDSYDEQTKNALHDIGFNKYEGFAQDSWKIRSNLTLDFGIRLSYDGYWYDRAGNGIVAFDFSRYDPAADASELPGVVYHKIDSSVPLSGVSGTPFYIAPRVGVAWDTRGRGSTVLRGGFGVFRFHDTLQPFDSMLDLGAGVRQFSCAAPDCPDLAGLEGLGEGDIVFGGQALDIRDDKQPVTYNWSATVNQRLPWSMSLEAGYVGNKTDNLVNGQGVSNYNAVPLGGGERPLPQYGDFQIYRHSSFQNYHAFQSLLTRTRGRFNFTFAYTWSKALGILSGGLQPQGNAAVSEYQFDQRQTIYGVLSTDRTHIATATYSWLLPDIESNKALDAVFGGWQIAGISTYISGGPLQQAEGASSNFGLRGTLADGTEISPETMYGTPNIPVQPIVTCDPRKNVPDGYLFNPSCFAAPEVGQLGAFIFPYIKGQAYHNHDLSLFKNFALGNGRKLQFRLSAYNFINHPLSYPDTATNLTMTVTNGQLDDPNGDFGRLPKDNKFGRRIVQLGLRFLF
jgi:Carboxypeptidase regulatory-like domain